jgi:hypothetical protein
MTLFGKSALVIANHLEEAVDLYYPDETFIAASKTHAELALLVDPDAVRFRTGERIVEWLAIDSRVPAYVRHAALLAFTHPAAMVSEDKAAKAARSLSVWSWS